MVQTIGDGRPGNGDPVRPPPDPVHTAQLRVQHWCDSLVTDGRSGGDGGGVRFQVEPPPLVFINHEVVDVLLVPRGPLRHRLTLVQAEPRAPAVLVAALLHQIDLLLGERRHRYGLDAMRRRQTAPATERRLETVSVVPVAHGVLCHFDGGDPI